MLWQTIAATLLDVVLLFSPVKIGAVNNGNQRTILQKRKRSVNRNLQTTSEILGYFDDLRTTELNSLEVNLSNSQESSIYEVILSTNSTDPTIYRLAELKVFVAFSDGASLLPGSINDAFAAVLAVNHFNRIAQEDHPVLSLEDSQKFDLQLCNVRLTMELLDSQHSPSVATQTFSSVLQRPVTLENPAVSAIIGSSRSSVTAPLAIFSGVQQIPQVSYGATSTDFEVKTQFPYFGRTVPSTKGEAAVAVRYFESIDSTHVAILFITDSFGSSLQKAFQEAASEAGISTESIAFSADVTEDEARAVALTLKRLQYFHVYAIHFAKHLEPILSAASQVGATGPEYLFVYPSFDVFQQLQHLKIKSGKITALYALTCSCGSCGTGISQNQIKDSLLAKSLNGAGLLQLQGGVTESHLTTLNEGTDVVAENLDSSFGRFQSEWRKSLQNADFQSYVKTKYPEGLSDVAGFDEDAQFSLAPTAYASFVYDAILAMGLSMCEAGKNSTFFNGGDVYEQFRKLDFQGASGDVRIVNETGSRNVSSVPFVLWNVRVAGVDLEGFAVFEFVPSHRFENNQWKEIANNIFVFADGSTVPPGSLPPVPFNYHYIGTSGRGVGYTLMSIVMITALVSIHWVYLNREDHVVKSSQPLFLVLVSLGAFTMAASILPLGLEETFVGSSTFRGLNTACMITPWLYILGWSLTLSALMSKTRAVHKAYVDPKLEVILISSKDIMWCSAILLSLNFEVLLVWSLVSPLEWIRIPKDTTDSLNRPLESYAVCDSERALPFAIIVALANVGPLIVGTWWAYNCRNIATEYNESRFIGVSMAAVLQAWTMGIPILIIVRDDPSARFFVESGLIFVTSQLVLLLTYIPKMLALRASSILQKETSASHFDRNENEQSIGTMLACDQAGRSRSHEDSRSGATSRPGLKILHNPRSSKNLVATGGLEMSQRQLEMFRLSEEIERIHASSKRIVCEQNLAELQQLESSKSSHCGEADERSLSQVDESAVEIVESDES